jgi:16S rRNA (guanine(966)-N(2))-methyltransferase RsmD
MRIIAGAFKGRRLRGPEGEGVRPTSDRLRETLFNILMPRIAGARVLDGFAGTGALGLEALSRGAAHATFVEADPRALRVLRQNAAACGVESTCTIVRDDVRAFAARRAGRLDFDLVLLDPPYAFADPEALLADVAGLLATGGLLVLEHSRRRDPPAAPAGLDARRTVHAGDSALTFYHRRPEPARDTDNHA